MSTDFVAGRRAREAPAECPASTRTAYPFETRRVSGDGESVSPALSFVAASPSMRRLRAEVERIATVEIPVLLAGESGTGKEVLAHLIHKLSPRNARVFMKVNCAALPADLLESELFGYQAGAFTGAYRSKPGKFELCDGGTILLDEITEMPPAMQAKLLSVLQDQHFARLGASSRIRVDVRVLAATNIDLRQALESGKLREDLFYRLNVCVLRIAPLRDRVEDIPALLEHFLRKHSAALAIAKPALTDQMLEDAFRYEWPGNVRELENFAKRLLVLGDARLAMRQLRSDGGAARPSRRQQYLTGSLPEMSRRMKSDIEADVIRGCLRQSNWNRKEASRRLRISYKALLYKIRAYGLETAAAD